MGDESYSPSFSLSTLVANCNAGRQAVIEILLKTSQSCLYEIRMCKKRISHNYAYVSSVSFLDLFIFYI